MTGRELPPVASGSFRARFLRGAPFLLAAALAVVLASPGLRFTYLFDDFDFLSRAQAFRWGDLLPSADALFYRPISRELYFRLLEFLAPGNPVAGHVINAGLLAGVVILGGTLVAGVAGRRAGIIASFLIAAFSQWPVLVGWVCGAQDLLSMAFLLLALHAEFRGGRIESLTLFVLAIISKETAVVAAPAYVAMAWLRGADRRAVSVLALQAGAVIGAWLLVHPGVRVLLASGEASTPGGYVGLDNPERWNSLLSSIPTLLHLSFLANPTRWPADLSGVLLAAVPVTAALLWLLYREGTASAAEPVAERSAARPRVHTTLLGVLLGVPPLILTCALLRHWAPYYACFTAVGLAIAAAPWLGAVSARPLGVGLAVFLIAGVWSRGVNWKEGVPTERSHAIVSTALREVERNFKALSPTLPRGSVVYVTTMATGSRSVHVHLHRFQALRVWYRDPTIQTLRPELHVLTSAPEHLFLVHPDLHVFQIDPGTLRVNGAGRLIERFRYRSVVRSYAIGLGMAGQLQRAADILLALDPPTSWDHAISYRIVATVLYTHGLEDQADAMLRGVPPLPRDSSIDAVKNLLTVPTSPPRALEQPAFRAFGLSWEDTPALRTVMKGLVELGYRDVGSRLAARILEIRPEDVDARRVIEEGRARRGPDRLTREIPEFEAPGP